MQSCETDSEAEKAGPTVFPAPKVFPAAAPGRVRLAATAGGVRYQQRTTFCWPAGARYPSGRVFTTSRPPAPRCCVPHNLRAAIPVLVVNSGMPTLYRKAGQDGVRAIAEEAPPWRALPHRRSVHGLDRGDRRTLPDEKNRAGSGALVGERAGTGAPPPERS